MLYPSLQGLYSNKLKIHNVFPVTLMKTMCLQLLRIERTRRATATQAAPPMYQIGVA